METRLKKTEGYTKTTDPLGTMQVSWTANGTREHVQDPVVLINSEMAERKRHADAMMKCWRVWKGAGALTHAVPVCVAISLKQQGNRVNTALPLICWWPDSAHIMNQMCYVYAYTDIGPHLRPLSHTKKCLNVITLDT